MSPPSQLIRESRRKFRLLITLPFPAWFHKPCSMGAAATNRPWENTAHLGTDWAPRGPDTLYFYSVIIFGGGGGVRHLHNWRLQPGHTT